MIGDDDARDHMPPVCDWHRTVEQRHDIQTVLVEQANYVDSPRAIVLSSALEDARVKLDWMNRAELARFLDAVLLQRAWIREAKLPAQTKNDKKELADDPRRTCMLLLLTGEYDDMEYEALQRMQRIINGWLPEERKAVEEYCAAVHMKASDNDDVEIPPWPAALDSLKVTK